MKKLPSPKRLNPTKKAVATVSAAALMLGVSHAATVAMHFQLNYCSYTTYTGFIVTAPAFGIAPGGWQNLTPMNTGYASCGISAPPYGYTLNQTISTNTSTDGLNPLSKGSLDVTWSANTGNFSDFGGYVDALQNPAFNILVQASTPVLLGGNDQVYATFLRDGINFGPPGGANNTGGFGGYNIDIAGLNSVFPSTPFVVELIAASDSMQSLTNAYVIDVTHAATNTVTYPSIAPVSNVGDAPWIRGHGGGLSTMSGAIAANTDQVHIMSAQPAHGGSGASAFNNAGTISGFIITDQPVVTMSPNSVYGNPGDSVALSAYAIGVPPLTYQWRKNGHPVPGATNTAYSIASLNTANSGNYDLVASNAYGVATSSVAAVTAEILLTTTHQMVADSNPANPEHDGLNNGAQWLASSSDGITPRSGVMQFVGTNTNGISLIGTTNLDSPTGSIVFWMRSAGTDGNASGLFGAALIGQSISSTPSHNSFNNEFEVVQLDSGGILFTVPGSQVSLNSSQSVSDNNWHLIVVTYDSSANGGAALYVDGALDSTNSDNNAWIMPVGKPLQIGYRTDGVLRGYDGLLDDVRIYNRQLNPAEVLSIRATGALVDTSALQMQLNFDTAPVNGLVMSWQVPTAVLQSALTVNGSYTNVPSSASPYYIVPKASQRYFRYYVPNVSPQARVSNPYLM